MNIHKRYQNMCSVFKMFLVQFLKLHGDFIWDIKNLPQIIEAIFAGGWPYFGISQSCSWTIN